MFQWYKKAVVCYVLLEDLTSGTALDVALGDGSSRCRWFTRGWTLQELLAPKLVKIFNNAWIHVGTKSDHVEAISELTGITTDVLLNEKDISKVSVAERMSWASNRQTKRKEDLAYCLLGIFDVNMPLIYGEGEKAFRRLQEEIIKHSNDLTIFMWDPALGNSANVPTYVEFSPSHQYNLQTVQMSRLAGTIMATPNSPSQTEAFSSKTALYWDPAYAGLMATRLRDNMCSLCAIV
jgi:hypothetical protein